MSEEMQAPEAPVTEEPRLEASRSKVMLWVVAGLVLIVGVGLTAITTIGGSVLYYKTPTEIVKQQPVDAVRLSGKLVAGSPVTQDDGSITFDITDGKTTVHVVYRGGATTALTSAARPGASMVAEGKLLANGTFESTNLLAKCPSKFTAAEPSDHASAAATS
jgi:cytochrome c-type biogenesis protein CcmE